MFGLGLVAAPFCLFRLQRWWIEAEAAARLGYDRQWWHDRRRGRHQCGREPPWRQHQCAGTATIGGSTSAAGTTTVGGSTSAAGTANSDSSTRRACEHRGGHSAGRYAASRVTTAWRHEQRTRTGGAARQESAPRRALRGTTPPGVGTAEPPPVPRPLVAGPSGGATRQRSTGGATGGRPLCNVRWKFDRGVIANQQRGRSTSGAHVWGSIRQHRFRLRVRLERLLSNMNSSPITAHDDYVDKGLMHQVNAIM